MLQGESRNELEGHRHGESHELDTFLLGLYTRINDEVHVGKLPINERYSYIAPEINRFVHYLEFSSMEGPEIEVLVGAASIVAESRRLAEIDMHLRYRPDSNTATASIIIPKGYAPTITDEEASILMNGIRRVIEGMNPNTMAEFNNDMVTVQQLTAVEAVRNGTSMLLTMVRDFQPVSGVQSNQ